MSNMTTTRVRYGHIKHLLASVRDPLAVTLPEFTRRHRLNLNSVCHAARRLGMRFKDQKVVKAKEVQS